MHLLSSAAILGAALLALPMADAVCYLEGEYCSVCWKTVNSVTTMAACPAGISMEVFQPLLGELESDTEYVTDYALVVDESQFPITAHEGKDIPHANIHSCNRGLGACTPFVNNTPGLSTHTEALSVVQATLASNGISTIEFSSTVKLEANRYNVIYHGRFFTATNAGLAKYDVAIGFPVDVVPRQSEIPASAKVAAAASSGIIVIFFLAAFLLWEKGLIHMQRFLDVLFDARFVGALFNSLAVLRLATFILAFSRQIKGDNALVIVVPFCYAAIAFGVILTVVSIAFYYKANFTIHPHDRLAPDALLRMQVAAYLDQSPKARRRERITARVHPQPPLHGLAARIDDVAHHFGGKYRAHAAPLLTELEKIVRRGHGPVILGIANLVLEAIPVVVIEGWVLVNMSKKVNVITPIAMVLASTVIGINMSRLSSWKRDQLRAADLRGHLDEIYETAGAGLLSKVAEDGAHTPTHRTREMERLLSTALWHVRSLGFGGALMPAHIPEQRKDVGKKAEVAWAAGAGGGGEGPRGAEGPQGAEGAQGAKGPTLPVDAL
jgi:hypothetical protein